MRRRISEQTKKLMEKQRNMNRDGEHLVEYSVFCKRITRCLENDSERYRKEKFLKTVQEQKSHKKCKRKMLCRKEVTTLKNWGRKGVEEVCKTFFINPFKSRTVVGPPSLGSEREKVSVILIS